LFHCDVAYPALLLLLVIPQHDLYAACDCCLHCVCFLLDWQRSIAFTLLGHSGARCPYFYKHLSVYGWYQQWWSITGN